MDSQRFGKHGPRDRKVTGPPSPPTSLVPPPQWPGIHALRLGPHLPTSSCPTSLSSRHSPNHGSSNPNPAISHPASPSSRRPRRRIFWPTFILLVIPPLGHLIPSTACARTPSPFQGRLPSSLSSHVLKGCKSLSKNGLLRMPSSPTTSSMKIFM